MTTTSYLPYHEPTLPELLISSTFLLALNAVNSVLDRTLACGLVGQVLIGTAWGEPGARWLSLDTQRVISSLGYLGLILVVYSGGVETNVVALRKNLVLSVAIAITGVVMPIALSFALLASDGQFLGKDGSVPPLQAFAAGAALCSTSLGTTFSVLQASGLSRTRLGAVLASAALLDDVVGLVMVRIITGIGNTGDVDIEPATILRPVLVSVAFAVAVPFACHYILKPGQRLLDNIINQFYSTKESTEGSSSEATKTTPWIRSQEAGFVAQTALLILLIVAADYSGASILLAAYLAGVVVSWWSGHQDAAEAPRQSQPVESHTTEPSASSEQQQQTPSVLESVPTTSSPSTPPPPHAPTIFETYYFPLTTRLLKPFFFASIGFSIPIAQLFKRDIIWRGLIYAILMTLGKLFCGLWLVRFPLSPLGLLRRAKSFLKERYVRFISKLRLRRPKTKSRVPPETRLTTTTTPSSHNHTVEPPTTTKSPRKPLSLYPASIIGTAMVARGEIGFLISSTAESQGVFRRANEPASAASDLFLVVTWAIFVCTILGPVCTGLLVRRIKKLEAGREGGGRDVLGVWGVD